MELLQQEDREGEAQANESPMVVETCDLAEEAWGDAALAEWAAEWSDPREDLYEETERP